MGNIKSLLSLLVGFIMAYLLGIAGFFAMFDINMLGTDSQTDRAVIAMFTGIPLGSSLGLFLSLPFCTSGGNYTDISVRKKMQLAGRLRIFITKILFRTGKFSVLCLFTSLVFGFLAARFLHPALPLIGLANNKGIVFHIVFFPVVPLFALIGYNAMEMLLRRRKESGRSAPQKHLNDRDSSPVIEKQNQ